MVMIPCESIIAERFWIRFLRVASDGAIEIVDRHNAAIVQIIFRLADGRDGRVITIDLTVDDDEDAVYDSFINPLIY